MSDPADAATTPTVPIALLKHDLPDGTWHLDLLIGVDASGTLPLRSIRVVKHPGSLELGDAMPCQVAEDHDPKWLRHQGTVSNNRGETTRIDDGEACWIRHGDESFEVAIQFGQKGPWRHFSIDGASEAVTCLGILESPPPAIDSRRGMDERTTVMTDPSTENPASESPEEKHASTPAIEQPVPIAPDDRVIKLPKKIKAFEKKSRHEDGWIRTPNTTGSGAIHVRTFHAKLTDDALRYMDQMVNEWLDAHPQYEVKFVNSTVGTLSGKLKEPNLICQVWV
jgi:hypothetical protein